MREIKYRHRLDELRYNNDCYDVEYSDQEISIFVIFDILLNCLMNKDSLYIERDYNPKQCYIDINGKYVIQLYYLPLDTKNRTNRSKTFGISKVRIFDLTKVEICHPKKFITAYDSEKFSLEKASEYELHMRILLGELIRGWLIDEESMKNIEFEIQLKLKINLKIWN